MTEHDTYEDAVTDENNRRMRRASGRVDDARPLVAFLYELARDLVPTGKLEDKIDRIAATPADSDDRRFQFTNGWLARWAQDAAERLEELVELKVEPMLPDPARAEVVFVDHDGSRVELSVEWRGIAELLLARLREQENPRDWNRPQDAYAQWWDAREFASIAGRPLAIEPALRRVDGRLVFLLELPPLAPAREAVLRGEIEAEHARMRSSSEHAYGDGHA